MLDVREIHSLTDFLRNHKAHVQRIRETQTPEVLTVNGKAELVVLAPEIYQAMQEQLQHLQTLAAIREGLAAAERGNVKPAQQVFDEMQAKYGLGG